MKYEFLKHWRVVRYLIKQQYNISQEELELLLFLYSEGRFTKDDFEWYTAIVPWNPKRFKKLKDEGWIKSWGSNYKKRRAVYCLTHKAKLMCARVYRLLLEEEAFPMSERNPVSSPKRYMEWRYKRAMEDINKKGQL